MLLDQPVAANDEITFDQNAEWLEAGSLALLRDALTGKKFGEIAVVSSFGAESALLLHLVSKVAKDCPVLFVDTRMMFQETLDYQLSLSKEFGLTDVRRISQDSQAIRRDDVFGRLHLKSTNACCDLRKVQPLEKALEGFDGWVTGRKRSQSKTRAAIRPFEHEESGRWKFNPLAYWEQSDIQAYFDHYGLPHHPLLAEGYTSIGCAPCTSRPVDSADPRSGRWLGQDKTECGIHTISPSGVTAQGRQAG